MFVGHAALALAARPHTPRTSLGILMAAAFGLDLLWPIFAVAGLEWFRIEPGATAFTPLAFDHYPWSHSLVLALVWGVAALIATRARGRDALVVGALVVSHWVLDAVVHRPDLPLWPGDSPLIGLGLWNSIAGTFVIEGVLWVAGIAVYLRATRARSRTGTVALAALLVFLTLVWASGPFSPPPPSPRSVTVVAFATFLIPLWAAWADRHRDLSAPGTLPLPVP